MKHWKKFLAAFLSLLLVFAFACGCAQGNDDEEKDPPTIDDPVDDPTDDDPVEVERPTDEETRAMAMVDIILDNYAVYGGEGDDAYIYMKEYHNTQQVGYLWTNFCAVGMQFARHDFGGGTELGDIDGFAAGSGAEIQDTRSVRRRERLHGKHARGRLIGDHALFEQLADFAHRLEVHPADFAREPLGRVGVEYAGGGLRGAKAAVDADMHSVRRGLFEYERRFFFSEAVFEQLYEKVGLAVMHGGVLR